MKIIAPGTGQKGWSKKCKCTGRGNGDGGCGATLLVEQPDLFTTETHSRDETDTFVTFKCAACGVLTDIGEAWEVRLPGDVVDQLPNKKTWDAMQKPKGRT